MNDTYCNKLKTANHYVTKLVNQKSGYEDQGTKKGWSIPFQLQYAYTITITCTNSPGTLYTYTYPGLGGNISAVMGQKECL